MILAWLLLLTGLIISAVAIYYSVIGLAAIFAAAAVPVYIMGTTLEVAKLVCASWLKANWERVPLMMKTYMTIAVVVLMLITSMGIFGFLSKAHLDNNLIGGDVVDKVAIIDEKIKTQRDNIEASRKALLQMDSQVDQLLGRSADEKGAERAVQVRRNQARERSRLQNEITESQSTIAKLNEERAPIAKDLRKVEAEVGPIKYIAKLVYGDNPDANLLEKAVTWVIIVIVVVFDPLAVIMLLAAQMTFQWYRREQENIVNQTLPVTENVLAEGNSLTTESNQDIVKEATVTARFVDHGEHPKDNYGYEDTQTEVPSETPLTALGGDITAPEETVEGTSIDQWNKMIEEAEKAVQEEKTLSTVEERVARGETFIDGEGKEVLLEPDFPESSKKKTYMTKDTQGQIQVKERK
jgi:hypothetical protein